MVTLKEYQTQAKEIKTILKACKTAGDVKNLRHQGIDVVDALVVISGSNDSDFIELGETDDNCEVKIIRLQNYEMLDFPTYSRKDDKLFVDLYDEDIDEAYAYAEDVDADKLSKVYKKWH